MTLSRIPPSAEFSGVECAYLHTHCHEIQNLNLMLSLQACSRALQRAGCCELLNGAISITSYTSEGRWSNTCPPLPMATKAPWRALRTQHLRERLALQLSSSSTGSPPCRASTNNSLLPKIGSVSYTIALSTPSNFH